MASADDWRLCFWSNESPSTLWNFWWKEFPYNASLNHSVVILRFILTFLWYWGNLKHLFCILPEFNWFVCIITQNLSSPHHFYSRSACMHWKNPIRDSAHKPIATLLTQSVMVIVPCDWESTCPFLNWGQGPKIHHSPAPAITGVLTWFHEPVPENKWLYFSFGLQSGKF